MATSFLNNIRALEGTKKPQQGFYIYMPRFQDVHLVKPPAVKRTLKMLQRQGVEKPLISQLKRAYKLSVFPFQKVMLVMEKSDVLLFIIDVPAKMVDGNLTFSFSWDEFMEKYPNITECHYYEPDKKDFDENHWDLLSTIRKHQVDELKSCIEKEMAGHKRGLFLTDKPPALWSDEEREQCHQANLGFG